MKTELSRREFVGASLAGSTAVLAGGSPARASAPAGKLAKGLVIGMLPGKMSMQERFKMAVDAGFDVVEAYTTVDERAAEEIKKASEDNKLPITSVMNQAHWSNPLSSSDPEVVRKSMEGMRTSLRNAKLWGADAVLLVPAVVNAQVRYKDAWDRSRQHIRELLPLAEQLKVVIAVENVWNKFLLSPMEFASYVDSFQSRWVQAYFDVGNVVLFGYPQDWIRTLGKRVLKVHLKDFKIQSKGYSPFVAEFVNLGEGDIDWPEIRNALREISYSGPVTAELRSGDLAYLTDVRKRIERLALGVESPA